MSKQEQLLELRNELTSAYQSELRNVQRLIESGVSRIENPEACLSLSTAKSLAMSGEAGEIFCDELGDAVMLVLERYERNLRKEMARLGLYAPASSRDRKVVAAEQPALDAAADRPSEATDIDIEAIAS